MANRFVKPIEQDVDASGDVLAGAKLSFFVSGTTTPRTVFQDVNLTIAHAQPVVADGAGNFPEIFLDGSAHRAILTDANDVQIRVTDDIFGIPSTDEIQLNFETEIETFVATAGQTVFNLSNSYVIGNNQLQVYINGVYQTIGVNYTETSTTSFTLTSGVESGDRVTAAIGSPVTNTPATFNSLTLNEGANLTIAAGVVTITNSFHSIDTEALAATDDLDTINSPVNGRILILKAVDDARTVVVKDATGNINLAGGDFPLNNILDRLMLLGTATGWTEISRSDNGV